MKNIKRPTQPDTIQNSEVLKGSVEATTAPLNAPPKPPKKS